MDGREKKSKKPSVTNSKPPEEVTFFVDASLGGKIISEALHSAGAQIELHNDHFPQGTPDETWLKQVGAHNWVVLTKDDKIRYHELERQALLSAGVRVFVLTAKGLRGAENAQIFVEALPASFLAAITRCFSTPARAAQRAPKLPAACRATARRARCRAPGQPPRRSRAASSLRSRF